MITQNKTLNNRSVHYLLSELIVSNPQLVCKIRNSNCRTMRSINTEDQQGRNCDFSLSLSLIAHRQQWTAIELSFLCAFITNGILNIQSFFWKSLSDNCSCCTRNTNSEIRRTFKLKVECCSYEMGLPCSLLIDYEKNFPKLVNNNKSCRTFAADSLHTVQTTASVQQYSSLESMLIK